MTPEQEKKLDKIYDLVVAGNGDIEPSLWERVVKMERMQTKIYNVLKGVAIGLIIGAFVLGYLTLKDVLSFVK